MAKLNEIGSSQAIKDIKKLTLGVESSAKRVTQKVIDRRRMQTSFDELEVVPYGNAVVISGSNIDSSSLSLEAILLQETRDINEEVLSELTKELKGVIK